MNIGLRLWKEGLSVNHEFVGTLHKPWVSIDTEGYEESPKIEVGIPYTTCVKLLSELLDKNYSYYSYKEVADALTDLYEQIGDVLKDNIRFKELGKHFSSQNSVKKQEDRYGF